MQNKQPMLPVMAVVITIVAGVGLVAIPALSEWALANPDTKSKRYVSEDGSGDRTIACTKDTGGCKNVKQGTGENINQLAKEFCESDSGQNCKQSK